MLKHITLSFALALTAAACGSTSSSSTPTTPEPSPTAPATDGPQPTQIVIKYDGQPISPEFHQTYEITITPSELRRTVNGPRDATSEQTLPLTAETYASLVESMRRHGLAAQDEVKSDMACTGGGSYRFEVTYPDREPEKLYTYRCGGTAQGTLAGDLKAFLDEVNALLPEPPNGMPNQP
jgi:hypothetical protein